MRLLYLISIFGCLLLSSCAGYKLGGAKPSQLSSISSISVPQFNNETLDPRSSTLMTSSAVDALVEDGTYKVRSSSTADAVLKGTVERLQYIPLRGTQFDTLRPEELQLNFIVSWELISNKKELQTILDSGVVHGRTSFFTSVNQATGRENAKAEASRDAARKIISRIADGF